MQITLLGYRGTCVCEILAQSRYPPGSATAGSRTRDLLNRNPTPYQLSLASLWGR